MSGYWAESWPIWVSAFCVLAIYSYLVKDNPVYRTMMQVFIGVNLGYQAIVQWRDVLYPQWWMPMLDGIRALFGAPGSPWGSLWVLVGVLGLLFYFQLSRKYFWLSRIVIGITIGIGAGLTFKSQLGQNIPQIGDSFKQLAPATVQVEPRVLLKLPGSAYAPLIDGSVAVFASGKSVEARELLSGVQLWRIELGGSVVGPVSVVHGGFGDPTEFGTYRDGFVVPTEFGTYWVDRANGSADLTVRRPERRVAHDGTFGDSAPVTAILRQPQFTNGVSLRPNGDVVSGVALRDGVAPNVRKDEVLWTRRFSEPVQSLKALDGVVLVRGFNSSELWETPVPTPRLTPGDYFDNWVFVITMLSVMVYFFFIFPRPGKVIGGISTGGRWLLMIGFGAFFGNTVMTRMSYLLDRLMFLIDEWLRPFFHHLFG